MSNTFKNFAQYQRIHELIQRRSAGTPDELAAKLGKDKRTIQRYISDMKDMGFPIALCKWRKTYYYTCYVIFKITFKVSDEDQSDNFKESDST